MPRPLGAAELPIAPPRDPSGPQAGDFLQLRIGVNWRPLLCLGQTDDGMVIGTLFLYGPEDRRSSWVIANTRHLPSSEAWSPPVLLHVIGAREGTDIGNWRYKKDSQ